MAEVWSARRVNRVAGEKYVAIKILARHVADNPRYSEMFVSEAKISLLLNHANIVTVFDVVQEDDECYMVMELIEGMTLSQLARGLARRGEKVPVSVAVYIIAELLRALAYAHGLRSEQGSRIVHRDVSPQNVMVTTSGEVKLMDFGIARFSTEETSGNLVKGKLQYMPPEQLAKRTREATIDLFAVGGVLQELLEGKRFRGKLEQEVLLGMVIRGESPPLTVEVPDEIAALRDGLLEPDPDKRTAAAKQALAKIYDWPGYRNASLQLEELVCQFVEPASSTSMPNMQAQPVLGSAPISLPTPTPTSSASAPAPAPSASTPAPSASTPAPSAPAPAPSAPAPAPAPAIPVSEQPTLVTAPTTLESELDEAEIESEPGAGAQPERTGGGTREEGDAPTDTELPGYAEPSLETSLVDFNPRGPAQRIVVIVAACLGALLLIAVWRSGVFSSTPEQDDEPEVAAKDEPEVIVAPPVADLPKDFGTSTGGEEDPDEAEGDGGEGDDKATIRVPVEFVANDFYFVYIKVSGRIVTLEPTQQLRLPVGSHTVYLRQKPSDGWKRAGTIKLKQGAAYRVEMKKPAALRLRRK